jgi:hypothetical protein
LKSERTTADLAWIIYAAATLFTLAVLVVGIATDSLSKLMQASSAWEAEITGMHLILLWILLGIGLFVWKQKAISPENAAVTTGFFAFAALSVIMMRERMDYVDLNDYVNAASNIVAHEPFNSRYIYPPLLATFLQPFVAIQPELGRLALLFVETLCLWGFFYLTTKALTKYIADDRLAAIASDRFVAVAAFLGCLVNTPLWRTMYCGQINIAVADLVLVAFLFSQSLPLVSALALATAVHLKVSPIIFVLPFLLTKNFKWLAYFTAATAGIAAFTCLLNSPDYYTSFWTNVRNIYHANPGLSWRDNSWDSLVYGALHIAGAPSSIGAPVVAIFKLVSLSVVGYLMFLCTKQNTFSAKGYPAVVSNGFPLLCFLTTLLAPITWEHHFVMLLFPCLILLPLLSRATDVLLFGVAWFSIFVVPTFTFYPVSYTRLFGSLLMLSLIYRLARRQPESPTWLKSLQSSSEVAN